MSLGNVVSPMQIGMEFAEDVISVGSLAADVENDANKLWHRTQTWECSGRHFSGHLIRILYLTKRCDQRLLQLAKRTEDSVGLCLKQMQEDQILHPLRCIQTRIENLVHTEGMSLAVKTLLTKIRTYQKKFGDGNGDADLYQKLKARHEELIARYGRLQERGWGNPRAALLLDTCHQRLSCIFRMAELRDRVASDHRFMRIEELDAETATDNQQYASILDSFYNLYQTFRLLSADPEGEREAKEECLLQVKAFIRSLGLQEAMRGRFYDFVCSKAHIEQSKGNVEEALLTDFDLFIDAADALIEGFPSYFRECKKLRERLSEQGFSYLDSSYVHRNTEVELMQTQWRNIHDLLEELHRSSLDDPEASEKLMSDKVDSILRCLDHLIEFTTPVLREDIRAKLQRLRSECETNGWKAIYDDPERVRCNLEISKLMHVVPRGGAEGQSDEICLSEEDYRSFSALSQTVLNLLSEEFDDDLRRQIFLAEVDPIREKNPRLMAVVDEELRSCLISGSEGQQGRLSYILACFSEAVENVTRRIQIQTKSQG